MALEVEIKGYLETDHHKNSYACIKYKAEIRKEIVFGSVKRHKGVTVGH